MSRLRGHRPEAPNPTCDHRLTARPLVLAKTYGPGPTCIPSCGVAVRPHVPSPICFDPDLASLHAIPAVLARGLRRTAVAISTRFRPLALARYRALSAA